jgi:hypothetical protein
VKKKMVFILEMLRNGDRESHSYIAGVYDDEILALKEAWEHMEYRANKYDAHISGHELNGHETYKRSLSTYGWKQFEESCPTLAKEITRLRQKDAVDEMSKIDQELGLI